MPIDDQPAPAPGSAAPAAAYAGPDYGAVLWEPTPESSRATQLAAVIYRGEDGTAGSLTYGELDRAVAGVAAGLRSLGVTTGDRVAAYLPNVPEALIGMLAAASLGAIWSSCSPDFGATSVIDRFAQISPKVLIATPFPRMLSGKKLEVPVRKILLGTPLEQAANPDSLANPEVLKFFAPQDAR